MKRPLFILLLFLSTSLFAQQQQQKEQAYYQPKVEEIGFVVQQNWKLENPQSWSSFYWQVIRTDRKDANGYFWYYVYLYSNSYFNIKNSDDKYIKAVTYITDVNIMIYHSYKSKIYKEESYFIPHAVCDHKLDNRNYLIYFNSMSDESIISLEYGTIDAYSASNIQKKQNK